MTARKITVEQHIELGKQLQEARDAAIDHLMLLSNTYGKTKKPGKLAHKVLDAFDSLKCEMDDQLARDYPADFSPHVYYRQDKSDEDFIASHELWIKAHGRTA